MDIHNILLNSEHTLHTWVVAVRQFQYETEFHKFFIANKEYYDMIIGKVEKCGYKSWISFINEYFKSSFHSFYLYICPFAGNYGFVLDVPHHNTAYIIRCMPYYDENGQAQWFEDYFVKGVAHEYAHCFVNPVVELYRDKLNSLKPFLKNIQTCSVHIMLIMQ